MKFQNFEVSNYRGIQDTSIELASGSPGKVVTLIGLNESGKTTVLEALSNFLSSDSDTQSLVETIYAKVDPATFIPKERRGLFTDTISIAATVSLENDDIRAVQQRLRAKHNAHILFDEFPKSIRVTKSFEYEDSVLQKQMRYWNPEFRYTKGNATKVHQCTKGSDPIWQTTVGVLGERLPQVVYFPTFLFDMPDRIYLTEYPGSGIKDSYYRRVFEDVLKSANPEYSLEVHVIDRINSLIMAHGVQGLSDSVKSDHIDSVFRQASNEISRVIMGAWKDILEKEDLQLRVELRWGVDESAGNAIYVEPYIIERQQYKYVLRERSLGFRWFFSFLLFTQFRVFGTDAKSTVFLFDEPASHLHPAAQMELLNSFPKIMGENDYIIYSTHSHYMINPVWLEKAYIVNNGAVDLGSDFAPWDTQPNDIVAIRYKRFVSDNPTRVNYFQPVLDALNVRLSPLDLSGPAVIVEGKFDYHPFLYMLRRLESESELRVFPALGAGEMGLLSSLFRGMGKHFVIVLDADAKGKAECERYRRDYDLSDDQVFTLNEAEPGLDGFSFEGIYCDDVLRLIEESGLAEAGKLKAKGSALFQLLLATKDDAAIIDDTLARFDKLLKCIHTKILCQDVFV